MADLSPPKEQPSISIEQVEPAIDQMIEPLILRESHDNGGGEADISLILDDCTTRTEESGNEKFQIAPTNESLKDNGIFEFMTPERAIELYNRIHSSGLPDLEWKFYGRRRPGEQENEEANQGVTLDKVETQSNENVQNQTANTEFDFDEEFGDLQTDISIVNESLQLKKRLEPGSEKKTNLSDIMSDIMKESHNEND